MDCVDEKEGHDLQFIGYMVVAEKLPEDQKLDKQVKGIAGTAVPYFTMPDHFPAKIEVWQCIKCGFIKLSPAVFTRL